MASISTIYSSSPTLNYQNQNSSPIRRRIQLPLFRARPKLPPTRSVAREVPTDLTAVTKTTNKGLEKDPRALWRRYVDWLYQHKELGLYIDVSRVGFTDEFVNEMEPRFQAAFNAMEKLEKGAIANPDEGRMVGHYWLRDSNRAPNSFLKSQIDNTLDAVCGFANDVVSGKIKPPSSPEGRFTQILSVGIGGSALGPQFVAEALAPDNPPLKIRFIDNTDPAGIDHQIAQLGPELASTLVIVISKSGGTPETRNGLLEVQKAFREAGLDFPKQGVAITQENSLLDNTARIEGWLARFPMFDWVGGRTSVMSAVGLLPAALQSIDIREMLTGASLMDEANRSTVDLTTGKTIGVAKENGGLYYLSDEPNCSKVLASCLQTESSESSHSAAQIWLQHKRLGHPPFSLGYCTFLCGNLVTWRSKKQNVVARLLKFQQVY